jgi:hypothetical protein
MTTAMLPEPTLDSILDDVRAELSTVRWMTAREVWQRNQKRWTHGVVRNALRAMADEAQVEERVGGPDGHHVREYRAWK